MRGGIPPKHERTAASAADKGSERRRTLQFLGSLGLAGTLGTSAGCHSHHEDTATESASASVQRTLSPMDFALLSRLTELIIPKTETAGAVEAGVPDFIDAALVTISPAQLAAMAGSSDMFVDDLRLLFADGLNWIETEANAIAPGKRFLELSDRQQFTFLEAAYERAEADGAVSRSAQFLRMLKNLTVEGYYTSRQGLLDELGYRGNGAHGMFQMDCK